MNRKNKMMLYVAIIVLILIGVVLFGGYYFSREACIEGTLRASYRTGKQEIMHVSHKGKTYTLLANENGEDPITITTKQTFLLHKSTHIGQTSGESTEKLPVEDVGLVREDKFRVVFIRKVDPDANITKVSIKVGEGEAVVQDLEWKDDYACFTLGLEDEVEGRFIFLTYLDEENNTVHINFIT